MVTTLSTRYLSAFLLLALFLLSPIASQAATITAKTDRMNIAIDESFDLSFIADGDVDKAPDFSPLKKDFDILSQSQGSSVTIINGNFKKSTTYTLTLMPKRAGNLLIPAISFGKDSSQVMAISVGAASATPAQDAELILEVTPSHTTGWIQGQIILNVKLMSAVNLRQYGISKIDTGKFDVSVESLGDAKQYQTTQGNRNFLVIEQKFALYPQQAGNLTIEPLLAEVEAVVQSRSYFDPFNTRSKTLRARSRAIEIHVKNMPAQFSGKTWLPASDVQLVEEWSPNPPVFKVGEPVTRTLNLFVDGLTAAQLPQLAGANIDGIKQYPDQPVLNNDKNSSGIIGGRREKIALIPTRSGKFTLPAVEITWWNTKTGTTEVARLAERSIEVLPGTATSLPNSSPEGELPAIENSGDVLPLAATPDTSPGPYVLLSLFFASGWLLTGIGWWFSNRRTRPVATVSNIEKKQTGSKSAIKQACEQNNAAACKAALINWARDTLSPDINNLSDFIAAINDQGSAELKREVERLNTALYSATATSWQGHNLWQLFQQLHPAKASSGATTAATLEPLYK